MKKITPTPKMDSLLFFILSFMFLVISNANSQTVYYDSISKQKYVLVDVRKTYERLVEKGYESVEMYECLGNYYFNCKDFQKSRSYYEKLFKKYKLSQISSKSIEHYKKLENM